MDNVNQDLAYRVDYYKSNPLDRPIPQGELFIRTYDHHLKLDFYANEFWLEYDLKMKSFVQQSFNGETPLWLTEPLSRGFMDYLRQRFELGKITIMDDFYTLEGLHYPCNCFQNYLYIFDWFLTNSPNDTIELAVASVVQRF
ncbi:MAG: hypothetical protein DA405_11990 [Bacteroidetes bacterium]|nr:MAG: hypothetical protein DA405_11990 [Bacteroidota bacterium]